MHNTNHGFLLLICLRPGPCVFICMSDSQRPGGLQPTRLFCPWNFPGKNTGVGCHFILLGIFQTQGPHLHLLHLLYWQADSFTTTTWEPPGLSYANLFIRPAEEPRRIEGKLFHTNNFFQDMIQLVFLEAQSVECNVMATIELGNSISN